ncbi:MAG: hypothetical protein QOJ69_1369 [Actinomycetota bacterium]|jgi:uncharacterized repeat protein (TIGR03847 family)|nr:hypothetical protein [Actinomycetota bacterium]
MSASFELSDVARLTVGTEGPPGKRIFYLQAATSAQVVTLRLEKTQVAALVAYLSALLSDLPTPTDLPTEMDLVEPVLAEWVVGSLGVTYDEGRDRILLLAEELVEEGEDGASTRLLATRAQVAALAVHGAALVAAGRPPCQLCGLPLDPEGHVCPRLNGHRSS